MAYVPSRTATTGELISGTFEVLMDSRREVGLYLLAFAALGLVLGFEPIEGLISVLAFVLYFPAQFWLCRQMLTRAGMRHDHRFRVFSLFAMFLLLGFAIMVGFNFFWIPGILLGAKWIMAPSFLVAEEGNVFDAIGNAWRASDGSTLSLSLAYTAIGVIALFGLWILVLGATFAGGTIMGNSSIASGPVTGLAFSLAINVMPVFMMALSVAAYRLLSDRMEDVTEVFA